MKKQPPKQEESITTKVWKDDFITQEQAKANLKVPTQVEIKEKMGKPELLVKVKPQFEYRCVGRNGQMMEDQLNDLGKDGWELVDVITPPAISSMMFVFKRVK